MIRIPPVLETIAWFALYIGFAVFALTATNVSPIYRAMFIDGTSADWLPEATRTYVPGDEIAGGGKSPYFGRGWWGPEKEARWGKGARSTLVLLPTADLPAGSRIRGKVGGVIGGRRTEQTISITANGTEVAKLLLTAKQRNQEFDVPLPMAVKAGETLEIGYLVSDVRSPLAILAGQDGRELGVRFQGLAVEPAP